MDFRHIIFLPGMSGHGEFWEPVAEQLRSFGHRCTLIDWPGLGDNAVDPSVAGYEDLVKVVCSHVDGPVVLVGQSMGGYVAVRTALRPDVDVTHLVLAATSGGFEMSSFDAIDWRPGSRAAHPTAPAWAFEPTADLTSEIAALAMPVLLMWANRDEISPIGAGLHLLDLVPDVLADCVRQ